MGEYLVPNDGVIVEHERSKVNYEVADRMGEINNENPGHRD